MLNYRTNMKDENRGSGLCAECVSQDGCVLTHHSEDNLYGCEEFESIQKKTVSVDYHEAMKVEQALGLCATCESSENCTLKNSPGGVWHCEEFR